MVDNPISPAEFDARHEEVRAFLNEHDLGALLAYSAAMEHKWAQTGHVSYLSGWANHDRIGDSVVVVPVQGPAVLLLAGLPYMIEQIKEVSPIKDVRLVQAVDPNAVSIHGKGSASGARDFASETLAILEAAGAAGRGVGVAGRSSMPAPFDEALRLGLDGQLKTVPDIVATLRANKSPAELAMMREAARLSDLGFETMLAAARPGMRGIEILAEMERAVRRQGADHAKYWMASGPAPDWSDSRLDLKAHERVLEMGDLVATCSYVVFKGYWCHGQRTGTLGKPSAELDNIFAAAREAQDAGLERLKPHVPIGEVGSTIRDIAAKHGFDMPGGRFGHGIGMDYSESPVPLNDTNDKVLDPGMTVVVHSMFNLPGSEKMFIPLGDVCHITAEGPELLMGFSRDLFVAGG